MVSLYELASPSLRYPECVHGLLKEVSFGARRFSIYKPSQSTGRFGRSDFVRANANRYPQRQNTKSQSPLAKSVLT
jgi:hypothetical protein